jgi:GlpG protein
MRRLGLLTDKLAAEQFALYLDQRGLEARRDERAEGFEFWLYDEDRVAELRPVFERYAVGDYVPLHPPRPEPGPPQTEPPPAKPFRQGSFLSAAPWTALICLACVVATVATGFLDAPTRFTRWLTMVPMDVQKGMGQWMTVDDDPLKLVRQGEVWRLLTPAFLHGGILHLVLNLQWFLMSAGVVERVQGTLRLMGLTLLSAIVSNLVQYWWNGPFFCGLSGVGYAMYGYIWMKTLFQPETRFYIPRSLHIMFWVWTAICFSGLLPIANGAHAAGLMVGILYGLVPFL